MPRVHGCTGVATLQDAELTGRVLQVGLRVKRVLSLFVRRGLLSSDDAEQMQTWQNGGGFSLNAEVRIDAADRKGLEWLFRYCARPIFASERLC
ncbi:MAG: hypothetical protein ABW168_25000 [Sedimenticola sp.]